jgi:hypothetical protein
MRGVTREGLEITIFRDRVIGSPDPGPQQSSTNVIGINDDVREQSVRAVQNRRIGISCEIEEQIHRSRIKPLSHLSR